jgi:hypothetical protein
LQNGRNHEAISCRVGVFQSHEGVIDHDQSEIQNKHPALLISELCTAGTIEYEALPAIIQEENHCHDEKQSLEDDFKVTKSDRREKANYSFCNERVSLAKVVPVFVVSIQEVKLEAVRTTFESYVSWIICDGDHGIIDIIVNLR